MTIVAICNNINCEVVRDEVSNTGAGILFATISKAYAYINSHRSRPCVGCGSEVTLTVVR